MERKMAMTGYLFALKNLSDIQPATDGPMAIPAGKAQQTRASFFRESPPTSE